MHSRLQLVLGVGCSISYQEGLACWDRPFRATDLGWEAKQGQCWGWSWDFGTGNLCFFLARTRGLDPDWGGKVVCVYDVPSPETCLPANVGLVSPLWPY